ncbi:SAM-dependent methyltransferase [Pararhodonellum marinum]|uniref:SAM-dependent methyltransferase n=1 Tax=Pararhodonellum marinum TaxID=2755358 RepID=UPI00188FF40A|nr:class I SAM-dependent methyltransferase [Pararhodonellum marinum]
MKKCKIFTLMLLIGFFTSGWAFCQDVVYVPTRPFVVDAMLQLANVQKTDIVYDLGCGDGRLVIAAAKNYGTRGKGIDIDPERIEEANKNAQEAGVTDKVEFVLGNLFEADVSEATVVTLFLLESLNLKLRPKLLEQLKPGSRVVSNTFSMGDWVPDTVLSVDGYTIYLWTIKE